MKRAVGGKLFSQIAEERRHVFERNVADLAGDHFQDVIPLLDLNEIAMIQAPVQQQLRGSNELLHALGDSLRTVVAKTAHADDRPGGLFRQAVEQFRQAVQQRMGAVEAMDQHLVPAVEGDLVKGQH